MEVNVRIELGGEMILPTQRWVKAERRDMLLRRQTNGKEAKASASGFTQWANPESQESRENNLKNERANQSGFQNDRMTETKLKQSKDHYIFP